MKNKLKILCLYSVVFLLNQTSPLHAADHKEEIPQKHSQLSPSLDSERSRLIKRIYKHKEELERTKTYITLSVAHTCLSFYWASDDLIYRSMYAVLGAANTIGPWLPSKIQGPFNTVLWGIGWLLEAGRLGSSPKRYVCESVLGYSTLLLMDFAMHSDASGCYQKGSVA